MQKKHVSRRLRRFARANEAVSALEYAILVAVIAVGIGAALVTFSESIENFLGDVGTEVRGTDVGDIDAGG